MPLQALVCEESELALLAIQWRSIVNHFGMNLDLVNPLHVVSQLFKILKIWQVQFVCKTSNYKTDLNITVANFTNDKRVLATLLTWLGRTLVHNWTG